MLDAENNFGTLGLTVLQERRELAGWGVPSLDASMVLVWHGQRRRNRQLAWCPLAT